MAMTGCALLAVMFVMIVYDVTVRTLGFTPPAATSALTEYFMLYVTMFAAPYLVRTKAHVAVESIELVLPKGAMPWIARFVCVVCIAVSVLLAWYSVDGIVDVVETAELDIRSIIIPKWVLLAPMPVGFALCAVEFARYLLSREGMLVGRGAGESSI
jgi:TRAP-type C4-dicarboxylate transport system permease small subunit